MSVKTVIAMLRLLPLPLRPRRSFTQPRRSRQANRRPSPPRAAMPRSTGELLLTPSMARASRVAPSWRPGPDRDVRPQPDQALAEPAGDRCRSAGHGRTPLAMREISLIDMGKTWPRGEKLATTRSTRSAIRLGGASRSNSPLTSANVRRLRWSPPVCADGFIRRCCRSRRHSVRDGGADEGNADVQVVHGDCAHPEEFPSARCDGAYMRKPYDWSADVKN